MINDRGGINGRKINLVSVDEGYSPPKTFEQTRKLVEQDEVAFIFPASEHGLASSYASISTKERSRSYLKPQARPCGATRSIFHGASAGNQTVRRKALSMVAIC
jgi:hypothetical protein